MLRGNITYQTELGTDAFGNITRINNALNDLPKKLEGAKAQLDTLYSQQEAAKQELEKPFTLVGELAEKESRLALLNAELNIEGSGGLDITNDPDSRSEAAIGQDTDIDDYDADNGDCGDDGDGCNADEIDGDADEIDGDSDEPESAACVANESTRFNYPSEQERQNIPAKAKPPMLETIRSFNMDKKQPASNMAVRKPTELGI